VVSSVDGDRRRKGVTMRVAGFKIGYLAFSRAVRTRHRFVRDRGTDAFLTAVLETAVKRADVIEAGSGFWRAQIGCEEEDDGRGKYDIRPLPAKRMIPPRDGAREGRINPKGIPCLYLATDRNTAIAEVRPWRHARVSVGRFETTKALKVVDCSAANVRHLIRPAPSPPEEEDVWADINAAFARPIEPNDTSPDYVPTQVIAELFRHNGYDGVVFRSSVAAGRNVALFDLGAAKLTMCELHRVTAIEYRATEYANPYYVSSKPTK
jgi:RES domain-containing protein